MQNYGRIYKAIFLEIDDMFLNYGQCNQAGLSKASNRVETIVSVISQTSLNTFACSIVAISLLIKLDLLEEIICTSLFDYQFGTLYIFYPYSLLYLSIT